MSIRDDTTCNRFRIFRSREAPSTSPLRHIILVWFQIMSHVSQLRVATAATAAAAAAVLEWLNRWLCSEQVANRLEVVSFVLPFIALNNSSPLPVPHCGDGAKTFAQWLIYTTHSHRCAVSLLDSFFDWINQHTHTHTRTHARVSGSFRQIKILLKLNLQLRFLRNHLAYTLYVF